jgi:trimeric autotransporter adhesin
VGDDLVAAAGSSIIAASTIAITGDGDNADTDIGSLFNLGGTITGTAVTITGGVDGDLLVLTNLASATTANLGAGDDRILVGSNATPQSNTGGLFDHIQALLTVTGGAGTDSLEIDDSGDVKQNSGTIANTEIRGFGGNILRYGEIETLQLLLGGAIDLVTVESTASNTAILLDTGAGDDLIKVGDSANRLNEILGLIEVRGNLGNDILNVVDSGDTGVNAGSLSNSRITGLGMGDNTKGIGYGGFESLLLSLGSGSDSLNVTSIDTNTTVNLGAGADSITVGTNLFDIVANLRIQGGGNTGDTINVNSTAASDLTLDRVTYSRL